MSRLNVADLQRLVGTADAALATAASQPASLHGSRVDLSLRSAASEAHLALPASEPSSPARHTLRSATSGPRSATALDPTPFTAEQLASFIAHSDRVLTAQRQHSFVASTPLTGRSPPLAAPHHNLTAVPAPPPRTTFNTGAAAAGQDPLPLAHTLRGPASPIALRVDEPEEGPATAVEQQQAAPDRAEVTLPTPSPVVLHLPSSAQALQLPEPSAFDALVTQLTDAAIQDALDELQLEASGSAAAPVPADGAASGPVESGLRLGQQHLSFHSASSDDAPPGTPPSPRGDAVAFATQRHRWSQVSNLSFDDAWGSLDLWMPQATAAGDDESPDAAFLTPLQEEARLSSLAAEVQHAVQLEEAYEVQESLLSAGTLAVAGRGCTSTVSAHHPCGALCGG
jgi:hypothetical protein